MERGKRKSRAKLKSKDKVDLKKLFRFKSFTERIANVKIDVSHRIGHTAVSPEDRDTFFSEALQKWVQLNCTSDFVSFERDVRNKVDSLAQLVHHKFMVDVASKYASVIRHTSQHNLGIRNDEILSKLKDRLLVKNTLAYEPLLDLLVQFARDLHSEFYPYFKEVFPVLVDMCDCQDADLIQCVFTTLAYLLKFLWRQIVRDLESVFSLYSDLLSPSQRPHIQRFAVESFGFLLRKVRDQDELVDIVFTKVTKDSELADGVGQLLFEVCKGVPKQFHSCTEKLLPLLLRQLGTSQYDQTAVFQTLTKLIQLMAEHTVAEFSMSVWTPLLDQLDCLHGDSKWSEGEAAALALSQTLHLLGVMVSWRNGTRLPRGAKVIQAVVKILNEPHLPRDILTVAVQLAASLILVGQNVPDCHAHLPQLLKCVSDGCRRVDKEEVGILLTFFQELVQKYSGFEYDILAECLCYCEADLHHDANLTSVLKFLCELCLHFDPTSIANDNVISLAHPSFALDLAGVCPLPLHNTRRSAHQSAIKSNILHQLELLLKMGVASVKTAAKLEDSDNLDVLWAVLVCLKYIRPISSSCLPKLCELFDSLKNLLSRLHNKESSNQITASRLLLVSQCLSTYAACYGNSSAKEKATIQCPSLTDILHLLQDFPSSLPLLRSVYQYVDLFSSDLTRESVAEVLPSLQRNLSSPSSSVRLVTLRLLTCFNQLQPTSKDESEMQFVDAIETCLRAEEIPAHLHTYRDKLLWLQKLKYRKHKFRPTLGCEDSAHLPLRYLLGMFYVNFSLLWEPVSEIIRSYAVEDNKREFWSVFCSYLEEASSLAGDPLSVAAASHVSQTSHDSILSLFHHQKELMTSLQIGRPDHTNFRILLWKCVSGFDPDFSESKSRILVPILLRFIENEFSLKENALMESQDISKTVDKTDSGDGVDGVDGEVINEEEGATMAEGEDKMDTDVSSRHEEMEEEGSIDACGDGFASSVSHGGSKKAKSVKRKGMSGHSLNKTLTVMLTVFTKFHNPRSFYKEKQLNQLYMKLLAHHDAEIQKLALFCLLTYKPPYLLPYKENFELLLDDTSFREELSNFSMESECCVVSQEHREQLLPILIRVLYGCMHKQGGHGSSKFGGTPRRGVVLRFLGGCEGGEMTEFINLLILPFKKLLSASEDSDADHAHTQVDASCVIPLKKQQGFLNMFGQMISILGSKLESQLSVLFPITVKLGSSCAQLLEQRDKIQPHCVNALKIIRQMILARINECYGKFTDFDFSPYQEEMFSALVWPQVTRLPQECVQSPTPLMKILLTWSKHHKYHSLLNVPIPQSIVDSSNSAGTGGGSSTDGNSGGSSSMILHYVYSCLSAPRVSSKVCSCVMEMTVNLLSSSGWDGPGNEDREYALVGNTAKALESTEDSTWVGERGIGMEIGNDTNGPKLVLPLIPKLLSYMSGIVETESKRVKAGGNPRDLHLEFTVISKISQFVKDPSESSHLIQLLLPFLLSSPEKQKTYEEDVLTAVVHLTALVDDFTNLYRPLSQLFGALSNRQARSLLCNIFQELSGKDPKLNATASIIQKLNSWDKKHVNEPNYSLRLEGFSDAKQLVSNVEEAASSKVYLVLPVLHNALFFLSQSEEMSIRDAAASFVADLISHTHPQDGDAFNQLILTTMVAAVKKGLRSSLEFARLEFISVLSQLVKAYPSHPRFSSMAPLSHHEPEADFFENVKHIQLHRRTRAFRKLAGVCREGSLSQLSIMNFILPLANHVVFTPVTNTEQNLVAETVNVIGSIASQLSWTNYSFILHHYLRQLPRKLELQKTLIKVVVVVLDNFHFDLSSIQLTSHEDSSTSTKHDSGHQPSSGSEGEREGNPIPEVEEDGEGRELEEAMTEHDSESRLDLDKDDEGESEGSTRRDEREQSTLKGEADLTKQLLLAKKIHKTIVSSILPSLEAVLTKRIDIPGHKLSRLSHEDETNSEILRVPVAMAITKLLLTLPVETLHTRLPSLLLKVCQTLKNRSCDVRDAGRNTLVKMAGALGPKYVHYIVKEMKAMLTRGYMLHVLSYSLHSLLKGISSPSTLPVSAPSPSPPATPSSSSLKSSDLDACLDLISSVLVEDLFGVPAEERESGDNVAKIPESKSPQSLNSYELVARFLSPRLVPDLLAPVREVLESKSTAHVARTVEEICRRVSLGVQNNEGFTPQALLVFIHSLLNDSIPQLSGKSVSKPRPTSTSSTSRDQRTDSRLIPPEPGRSGPKPISAGSVGASIIKEFGLQLLHIGLKRGKFDSSSKEQLGMLDPFVPLLSKSLSSPHVKVLSRTLHCLVWVVRMPLPSLEYHIDEISPHLFGLLQRYARAGAAVGSNRELVLSAFKAMTVILRDFRKQNVTEDELTVLLSFIEEDVYDHQRQSTAFPLLKAILGRKLVCSEMFELMHKICQLSVTSDSEHTRQQCRQCILQFMMDYPLGKKLNRYLDFIVVNLSYEHQSGRESVIEQLSAIFTKFPEGLLNRHATFFFVPLCCQLINDESATCKKMIAETLKILLRRIDTIRSNEVQSMIESWFNSDKLLLKRLGCLTLGLLIEVEGQSFEKRLSLFLPLLSGCLSLYDPNAPDGTEEETAKPESEEERTAIDDVNGEGTGIENGIMENGESEMDIVHSSASEASSDLTDPQNEGVERLHHLLFSCLSTLRKIFSECSLLRSPVHCETMNKIWGQVQVLLLHPHAWVRLVSSQLYGLLFAAYAPDELVTVATQSGCGNVAKVRASKKKRKSTQQKVIVEYICQDTVSKVQELCHASCIQLSSPLLTSELANQTVKNLVYLGKVLRRCEEGGLMERRDEEGGVDDGNDDRGGRERDLTWLVERLSRMARFEAAHHPKESIKRTSVLQWSAAISMDLGPDHLPTYLPSLLRPVYRELTDVNKRGGDELHTLAQEVVDLMKGVCGKEAFSQAYAQVHQVVLSNREKRRQQAALEAVANPDKSIRRKQRKHELKKLAKKRKILLHRPTGTSAAAASRKRIKLKHH